MNLTESVPRLTSALGRDMPGAARLLNGAAVALTGTGVALLSYRWFLARMIDSGWVETRIDAGRIWGSFSPLGISPWILAGGGVVMFTALNASTRTAARWRPLLLALFVVGVIFLGWSEVQHHLLGWIEISDGGGRFVRDQLFHAPGFVLLITGWSLAKRALPPIGDSA